MGIGGERELERIGAAQWERLAEDARLGSRARMQGADVVARVARLADLLPDALAVVIARERADNPALEGKELPSLLLDAVARRCAGACALLR